MKIMLDEGAFPPERAHETDAGLDLRSPVDVLVWRHGSAVIDTGVHVQIPPNHEGTIMSKSGLNVKHDLTCTGEIDEGYQGSIVVKLYNHGENSYLLKRGDKIAQLVVRPVNYVDVEIVERFDEVTERGSNGFGSTGR